MGQIDQDFNPLADNVVSPVAVQVDNETHPAVVVLKPRIVETLFGRRPSHGPEYYSLYYQVNRNQDLE
jgi:hypothetical protein